MVKLARGNGLQFDQYCKNRLG